MIATYNGHMGPIKKKAKQKRLSNHFPKFEMVLEQLKFWMISPKNGFLVQKNGLFIHLEKVPQIVLIALNYMK